jgi:hypothetical protein
MFLEQRSHDFFFSQKQFRIERRSSGVNATVLEIFRIQGPLDTNQKVRQLAYFIGWGFWAASYTIIMILMQGCSHLSVVMPARKMFARNGMFKTRRPVLSDIFAISN